MLILKRVSFFKRASCLVIVFFLCSQSMASQRLSFEGRATDINSDELLYTEKHRIILSDSGEYQSAYVEYIDPQGEVFAKKTLDYSNSLFAPDMVFYDKRTEERVAVSFDIKTSYLRVLNERGLKRQETMIKVEEPNVVVDAGFDRFIEGNWLKLKKDKKVSFTFLALTRSQLIDFELINSGTSKGNVELELHPRNFFINILVDTISLNYDQQTKRLSRFEGLTNIERFENGKRTEENHIARIDYLYEPLEDIASSSNDMPNSNTSEIAQ